MSGRSHSVLGAKVAFAFLSLLMQSLATRGITFFAQLVLARLLLPSDFGEISLALTITTIGIVLANFGVDDFLVQRGKRAKYWLASALVVSLGFSFLAASGIAISAPGLGVIFHNASIPSLVFIMATALPITSLSTLSLAKLKSDMRFQELAAYLGLEVLFIQLLTILFAAMKFGVYSFAIPVPLVAAMKTAALVLRCPVSLSFPARRWRVQKMIGSSGAITGTRLLTSVISQADYFILGLVCDAKEVGYYYFAFRFSSQPITLLTSNLSNVLFPALSSIGKDLERQANAVTNACVMLANAIVPLGFLQAAVLPLVFTKIFSAKWAPAVLPAEILSIGLPFNAVLWTLGSVMSARGEFTRLFKFSVAASLGFILIVSIGASHWQVVGAATGVATFYFFLSPIYASIILKGIATRRWILDQIYLRPTVIGLISSGGVLLAGYGFALERTPTLWAVLGEGLVGAVSYAASFRLLSPSAFTEILSRLRRVRTPRIVEA